MDGILPILAVVAIAAQELREWERFPPRDVAAANARAAEEYSRWLYAASYDCKLGGWALWREYRESQQISWVWYRMNELHECDDRDGKLQTLQNIRAAMADDAAFYRGYWPSVIPPWHCVESR